jgi:hypothetical protein
MRTHKHTPLSCRRRGILFVIDVILVARFGSLLGQLGHLVLALEVPGARSIYLPFRIHRHFDAKRSEWVFTVIAGVAELEGL